MGRQNQSGNLAVIALVVAALAAIALVVYITIDRDDQPPAPTQPPEELVWQSPNPPNPQAYEMYPDGLERQRYHCRGQEVIEEFQPAPDWELRVFCGSQAAYERWQEIKPLLQANGSYNLSQEQMDEYRVVPTVFVQDDIYYQFQP